MRGDYKAEAIGLVEIDRMIEEATKEFRQQEEVDTSPYGKDIDQMILLTETFLLALQCYKKLMDEQAEGE